MALSRLLSSSGRHLRPRFLCATTTTTTEISPPPTPPPPRPLTGAAFNKAIRSLFKLTEPSALATSFKQLSSTSPHFRSKTSIYRSLVLRLASSGHFDAVADILEAQKLTPSIIHEAFAARIISLYGKAKMPDRAHATFLQLPELNCPRSFVSFNALLSAFVDSGDHDRATETFENVPSLESDIVPDSYSYNIMLHVMCLKGDMEKAMRLFGLMDEKGLENNVVTYCTLLNGYYNVRNGCSLEEGEKVWEMMREKGCAPDLKCFNAKMRALSSHGKMAEAKEVMEVARNSGLEPNAFSYTALIVGECKVGNLEGAKEVFGEMRKKGCFPNRGTFQAIVPRLCEAGELDMAAKLCHASVKRKCGVSVDVLQGVVDRLAGESRAQDAKKLVEFAWSSGRYSGDTLTMPPVCLTG